MFPYLLVAYGLCFFLQNKLPFLLSSTFKEEGVPDTLLDRLLFCTFCTGFHCGWLVWFLAWGVQGTPPAEGISIPFSVLGWGFASAGFCYTVDAGVKWLEANTG